ncbi:MAG: LysR family transcriptional regulator, partial [Evtepia sp.]
MDQKLFTFVQVCETRNYHAAADQLHITQPAVTQHIQALEREYACKLIRYNGHTISVTEEGEILLHYIRAAFSREQDVKQKLIHAPKRSLSIGATKSIGSYVLSDMLKPFLADPAHTANITVENTDLLLHLLNQNELDFAIVEGFFDKHTYDWTLLRRESFVGICAAEHPFAGRAVSISDLFDNTLLLREVGSGTRAIL